MESASFPPVKISFVFTRMYWGHLEAIEVTGLLKRNLILEITEEKCKGEGKMIQLL